MPVAEGRADLSGVTEDEWPVRLSGTWYFRWKEFGDPAEFNTSADTLQVPGSWAPYTGSGDLLPRHVGYATYQVKDLLPAVGRYALKLPTIHSAFDLYVNGERIYSSGRIDTSEAMEPCVLSDVVRFSTDSSGAVLLTFHVSNYAYATGSIWDDVVVGTESVIVRSHGRAVFFSAFLVGILLIMGFYYFGIWLYRLDDKGPLYFALMCFGWGLRELLGPETLMFKLFPDFPYAIGLRILYVLFPFILLMFLRFIDNFFTGKVKRWLIQLTSVVLVLDALFIALSPTQVFSSNLLVILPLALVIHTYALYVLILGVRARRTGSVLFLFGMIVMGFCFVNDLLVDLSIWQGGFIFPIGFAVSILCQSLVPAIRFSKSFDDVERLNARLVTVGNAQSRFVPTEFLQLLGTPDITKIKLGDSQETKMGVMFADLRNFSTIAEGKTASDTFRPVNSVLSKSAPLIRENHGFIDKYIGDAIMALFSVRENNIMNAALAMKRSINDEESPYRFGIGLHYGEMILGVVGESQRMEGTVISDAVNTASRVEHLTKIYGLSIIFTEELKAEVEIDKLEYRFLDETLVKGRVELVRIYELLDVQDPHHQRVVEFRQRYQEALSLRLSGEHQRALELFRSYAVDFPADRAVQVQFDHIQRSINAASSI